MGKRKGSCAEQPKDNLFLFNPNPNDIEPTKLDKEREKGIALPNLKELRLSLYKLDEEKEKGVALNREGDCVAQPKGTPFVSI